MKKDIRKREINETVFRLQDKFVPIVNEMRKEGRIVFDSIKAEGDADGNFWEPVEEINGRYIFNNFDSDPDETIETSKKVADDYQKVIAEFFKCNPDEIGNLQEDGKKWLFGKLMMWGGSIVEEGLMSHQDICAIADDFEKFIAKKGEKFFGYFHGNVIGDHIFVEENKNLYLFGMRIVSRPGRGYYDFLRALDWFLLKNDNQKADFEHIVSWMKKYLGEYDWEEVKLVFAFRCIGILGWDMLHRGDLGKGDTEAKKELLLKFIRREY